MPYQLLIFIRHCRILAAVYTVVETPTYLNQAKRAGVSDEELNAIAMHIAADPACGDLIPGTGGARKVRFAATGRGKRGGYRIIHFFAADDVPVFLLAILSKGQRADLTQGEKNDLRKILGGLADDYRSAVRENAKRPRRT
jgi:hypothetical protein